MQLLSFIKKNIVIFITIFILLIIQALGIIKLPEYISKIVDIGIERYGIDSAVPKAIRKTEMDKLMVFINDESVLDNFNLIVNKSDIANNKGLENIEINEPVYILKNNIDTLSLNYKFARAESLLLIVNKDQSIIEIREKIKTNITKEISNTVKNMFGATEGMLEKLETLGTAELNVINNTIDEKLSVLTEDILSKVSARYLQKEYSALNLKNVQENYMIKSISEMIAIAFVIALSYILSYYAMIKFSAEFGENLRENIFNKVIGMQEENFDKFTLSSLINRTVYDVQTIQKAIPLLFRVIIYLPVIFIGSYIKIREMNSGFEESLILIVMFILLISVLIFKKVVLGLKGVQKLIDKINSIVRDSLNNIFVVKNRGKNKHLKKFGITNSEIQKRNEKVMRLKSLGTVLMGLIVYLVSVYILWHGAIRIRNANLMIGSLMAIMDYLFQISFITIMTLREATNLVRGFISYKRCNEIFIKEKNNNSKGSSKIDTIDLIEFKNVYFKYPDTKEYILENFNMTINSKEHIAIVGNNASGKSTIIKLLLKFYKPEKGEILVNGINIEDYDTNKLREKFSVVPQGSDVFSGDLNSNIKFGNENISKEELEKIKETVQLTEFEKENKLISYKGKNISGGQKQRIAIARALAKKSDVIILDEAYTSLDANTKRIIQENIKERYNNKTIIDIGQDRKERLQFMKVVEL